jgi:uncharacterized protein (DUF885 family)
VVVLDEASGILGPTVKGSLRLFGLLLLGGCSYYTPDGGPDAGVLPDSRIAQSEIFQSVASAYIDWNYSVHPGWATADGVHEYDSHLGIWTREAIESQARALDRYQRRLMAIDPADLDAESYYDYLVLRGRIGAALFDLMSVRGWETNPNFYREIVSQGLYTLAALAFDTADRRMVLATERLRRVPEVLAAARANLEHPPRIYTEIAIDEFTGTHQFLKTGLPQAFAAVKDETLRARFAEALKPALEAIEAFIDWMRKDLLPASTGSFALGAERYRQKVALDEGIDLPIDDLLERGTDLLRSTREELARLAGERPVKQLLRETSKDHPKAETLIPETQALLDQLKAWASTVVNVPADASCKVQETPVFRRSLSFASMETPGPFEKVARDAYYSVTLPDPSWPLEKQEQHLSFFNRYSLPLISVHEAYPGHYVQFLGLQQCSSKVRKVFGCASFSEGWAHYCEQLYVDLLPDAPVALRIHQLQLALVRICRYIAGIQMHTKGMTVEQAVEFFVNEGYMERAGAEREARRGAADPTYLVYTLGKHEILAMREEYRRRTGGTLAAFHNALLQTGYPPLPIARKILFGER